MKRRDFLASLAASGAIASVPSYSQPGPGSIKAIANACGIDVGMQSSYNGLHDPSQSSFILANFNTIVAGNEFKWGGIHPNPDTYNFTKADWVVNYTQQNGLKFHGHNLCWEAWNPAWVDKTLTSANAAKILTDHVTTVVKRYAGKVVAWDVVNEPVQWNSPGGIRPGPWLKTLGPTYIDIAFHAAQAADPAALRVLNLENVEQDIQMNEEMRGASLSLIRSLVQRRVPVQAVGLESHLEGHVPGKSEALVRWVKQVQDMGLQVMLTEFDVNDAKIADDPNNPGDFTARDNKVASVYADYLSQMVNRCGVKEIIFFALTDKGNWYDGDKSPKFQRADGASHRPSLLDANMGMKPTFMAVQNVFSQACGRR